jgi:TonB family protein
MGTFFACSLKSALCLAAFYLFYKLLLSRETFHRFNRAALLGIMALSLCIPFLALLFEQAFGGGRAEPLWPEPFETLLFSPQPMPETALPPPGDSPLPVILLLIYLTGCSLFLLCTLRSLCGIARLLRKSKRSRLDGRIRLAVHADSRIVPFSWMNYVVICEKDYAEAAEVILLHEQAHIRQYHSMDLSFAWLCLLFQWYNPAAWLIYGELQSIHEYGADRCVLDKGINAKQYQLLLIRKAVGTKLYSMASSFNHSNLKKRITMMLQKKSSSWARLKYTYVLPLAAIGIAAFARPEVARSFDPISSAEVSHLVLTGKPFEAKNAVETASVAIASAPPDTVYQVVDEMPEYPGGQKAMLDFITKNLQYPPEAAKDGIQGRAILQFVVGKDGKLRNITVRRSIHPALDAEAMRMIGAMPVWKPGKMKGKEVDCAYTIPVSFRLTGRSTAAVRSEPVSASPSDQVYNIVEKMPEYPGGVTEMMAFISENLRQPEEGIQGRVVLTFVVGKDGKLRDVTAVRSVHPALDAEAIRLVNAMPAWKPGEMNGQAVNCKYTIPIHFRRD